MGFLQDVFPGKICRHKLCGRPKEKIYELDPGEQDCGGIKGGVSAFESLYSWDSSDEYECCVRFEDGLRDELRVLIALQKERDFAALVEKAKIAQDVKHLERQNRSPIKRAKFDGSVQAGDSVVSTKSQPCADYGRSHLGECWKKDWGMLQMWAYRSSVRSGQPLRGRGQARGGNGFGRGHGVPGRGMGSTEARQPALVYAARHREDGDASDVITGTFLIHNSPFVALIDIGSTHSYVTCTVSEKLGIQFESTTNEMMVLSPLGQLVRVDKLFKEVPLEVQGVVFPANLMELPFEDFILF
ncbi:uncharacterized protein LOC108475257 [Gossypium arboreum]|uniref:uncharacterized protein LOC108475257 n=1 Tax=Gossypium arboreum TaxID=29729 RepID=UPI0008194ABB|nr:uncharacterized protein LOC108475257 [Gossypium arboreum]